MLAQPDLRKKTRLQVLKAAAAERRLAILSLRKPMAVEVTPVVSQRRRAASQKPLGVVHQRVQKTQLKGLSVSEVETLRELLFKKRKTLREETGDLCVQQVLDRDTAVRLFYHQLLPQLLQTHQASHLLLQLTRRQKGVEEAWTEETILGEGVNVPLSDAIHKLRIALDGGRPYALRIVVEAPGVAHALLALFHGKEVWLLDPNGDFSLVQAYFGDRAVLVNRLHEITDELGCELHVPKVPQLHDHQRTACSKEYCRGGACAFVTGALALRAVADRQPPAALVSLLSLGGPRPTFVAREVDELVALTVAYHVLSSNAAPLDLRARVQASLRLA